ncbi:MAG: isoprenoid biosynthesis protein ElbB, partial [Bacteroidia bacterium]
ESARIARGEIQDLSAYKAENFDALVLPGGFGAAKNLCSFAFEGKNMNINSEVLNAIQTTHKAQKPIGALCISPIILAKALPNATVTLGQDADIAKLVEKWGGTHENTTHGAISVDAHNKLVTTPCYMLDAQISDIYDGATALIKKVLELA